ncbi:MAG: cupin domain-containing protein [Granulosicoccus sp.]
MIDKTPTTRFSRQNATAEPNSDEESALPWWFTSQINAVNNDFLERAVSIPANALWLPTQVTGVDLRILEYIPGKAPRLTGLLRLDPAVSPAQLGENSDLEILMLKGELETEMGIYPSGLYIRLPTSGEAPLQPLTLRSELNRKHEKPALLYFASGQMMSSDSEQRRLDTNDESRWLPGPVEGTEVLPLHGHGTGNAMLIRWNSTIAFKPRLDPMGEEVLVLKGSIHDRHGHYPAGSWIRNPIHAWQSWGAKSGTVVYYKNGHFSKAVDHS